MWHDEPGSLTKTWPYLSEMGRLHLMGGRISQLKELPWLDMASEVVGHILLDDSGTARPVHRGLACQQ